MAVLAQHAATLKELSNHPLAVEDGSKRKGTSREIGHEKYPIQLDIDATIEDLDGKVGTDTVSTTAIPTNTMKLRYQPQDTTDRGTLRR